MKKFATLLLILFFVNNILNSQSCLPNGINFSTQEEIDNFQTNYPNCNEIEGSVMISDLGTNNISNLNGLSEVLLIGGQLVIGENSNLTSLEGLGNLSYIGGPLEIYDNNNLLNISSLENVTFIGGDLSINNNNALTNIDGLLNVTQVLGKVQIISCPNLTNVSGLSNLTMFGGSLTINNNSILQFIDGFENIDIIHGSLAIANNPLLQNINGLINLTSIGGNLYISNNELLESLVPLQNLSQMNGLLRIYENPSLTTLEGIENINPNSINEISIIMNSSLSECDVACICEYLSDTTNNSYIGLNSEGCNSNQEVLNACSVSVENKILEKVNIFPNPADRSINITCNNTYFESVIIYDYQGNIILHQMNNFDLINTSHLKNGIYIIEIKTSEFVTRQKLIIK